MNADKENQKPPVVVPMTSFPRRSRVSRLLSSFRSSPGYTLMRGAARFSSARGMATYYRKVSDAGGKERYLADCRARMSQTQFPDIDIPSFSNTLREEGMAPGLSLSATVVDAIHRYAESAPCYADRNEAHGFHLNEQAQASASPAAAAPKPQGPSRLATASETTVQAIAMYRPHWPGMRPDGIGRCGSLIASTCRSNQSLAAWLVAHTKGPASAIPMAARAHLSCKGTPEATTPQAKAHIGGNQVIGFSNSATTGHAGTEEGTVRAREVMRKILRLTLHSVNLNLHLLRPSTIPQTVAVPYPRTPRPMKPSPYLDPGFLAPADAGSAQPPSAAPTALVIGSGFGGLAAAIRLRARGYQVTVLEKLDAPGGRAYVYRQDGYTFDAGPTIVTVPHLFEELWALAGRKLADDVNPDDQSSFKLSFTSQPLFDPKTVYKKK